MFQAAEIPDIPLPITAMVFPVFVYLEIELGFSFIDSSEGRMIVNGFKVF